MYGVMPLQGCQEAPAGRGLSSGRLRAIALATLALFLGSLAPLGFNANACYASARVISFVPSSDRRVNYGSPVRIAWNIHIPGARSKTFQVHIPGIGTFPGLAGAKVIAAEFPMRLTLNVIRNGVVIHKEIAQRRVGIITGSYPRNFRTVFNDNVLVWKVSESLIQDLQTRSGAYACRWYSIASRLTGHVQDVYDFAHFLTPVGSHVNHDNNKAYTYRIWGETQGVDIQASPGQNERRHRQFNTQRLRLITLYQTIQAFTDTQSGSVFHEIMHAWANRGIPTHPQSRPWGRHWGVSSANGILGGFDQATLEILDHATNRYAAKHVKQCLTGATATCPPRSYSPLELYLAGWAAPHEVPPLWVAYDAKFQYPPNTQGRYTNALETPSGKTIFQSKDIRTYRIRDIQSLLGGPRSPSAQKDFRMITVMLMNPSNPPTLNDLEDISYMLRNLEKRTSPDPNHRTFSEVASHRATMRTDGITDTMRGQQTTRTVTHNGADVARLATWR